MAADDLFQVTPIPPLDPSALGVSPLAPPPAPPAVAPAKSLNPIMRGILGTLAGLAGPGAGTGMLQGLNVAQQHVDQQHQQNAALAERNYEHTRTDWEQQQRIYDSELNQRQQVYQANISSLRKVTEGLPDKGAYDQYIDAWTNGLQRLGYRVDANTLRQAAPFVAPKAEKLAGDAIDAWMKNPNNADLMKNNPDQAATAVLQFDRDGDGVPEKITLRDLAVLARRPFAEDVTGGAMFSKPGTTIKDAANADGILHSLVLKAKAEGKDPETDPNLMVQLQQQSIRLAHDAVPREAKPEPTVVIQTVENGKPVTKIVPKVAGGVYEKPPNAVTENRLESAQATIQTGNDIIAALQDPKIAAMLGPAMGRFNTLREFIGNPPPELADLAGKIDSFSFASMGVHGMRSVGGSQKVAALLDRKHTPESMIGAIRGLNDFSEHLIRNNGRDVPPDPNASQPQRIRVKRKADGQTGTLLESDFDPAKYEKVQ